MSRIAKTPLVATSLAPAMGAFALIALQKRNWQQALGFLIAALTLVILCYLLKLYAESHGERRTLSVTAVQSTDKEALAFIIAYLLPFLTGKVPNISDPEYWELTVYAYCVIGLVIYNSHAFHPNPVLAMFRYHFYQVTADNGMTYLLVTKNVVRSQTLDVPVTRLADYVYLEVRPEPDPADKGDNHAD